MIEPGDDVRVLHQVAWPGLTRPLDEMVAAPSGLWIVEHRPWQDIAVARGRVITADADVTLDVQHLDQVRVRVARDLGLTPVEAHALVAVPEEVPALRLEGVVIVGQRLVRQIILSPGRRLTPTQLDVLARRTAKVLGHAAPDRPQARPQVTLVSDSAPGPAPVAERPAASPFNRRPGSPPAPHRTAEDRPHEPALAEPVPLTEPVPELAVASPTEHDAGPTPPVPHAPPARATPVPAVPVRGGAPELLGTDPAPTDDYDEPPPPLPTPDEMGLPPALAEPLARPQAASADPIWPIAPPPGLWPALEPEPELAQLVTSADTDLDEDESDLERTRVVEATSTVPEVDDDESEMGRTRVVADLTNHPVTSRRGLPRLVEPGAAEPYGWTEPAWPQPYDEPTTGREPISPAPADTRLVDDRLTGTTPVEPDAADPDAGLGTWPEPTWPQPTTSGEPTSPAPADTRLVDDRLTGTTPVEPDAADPGAAGLRAWPEPAWPQPYDEPTTSREPISPAADTRLVRDRLTGTAPVEPEAAGLGAWPEPAWPRPYDEPTDEEPIGPAPAATGLVGLGPARPEPIDPEVIGTGPFDPGMLPELIEDRLIDPEPVDPEPVEPTPFAARPAAPDLPHARVGDGRDRPVEPGRRDQAALRPVESAGRSRPVEVYAALDDDVELTRIRPPDRPPTSQSLADARRAFFSGAGFSGADDDPVAASPQTPEVETAQDADEAPSRHGRPPAPARPAARLPVEWDDDPAPPSDGSRPYVAWDPPEEPQRDERPQVAWDDPAPAAAPAPGDHLQDQRRAAATTPEAPPPPERRSVAAGPRPPADHRPIEHTERPAQPVERPSRYRSGPQAARPAAVLPDPGPPQQPGGPAPRSGSAEQRRPARPRAVRTGPWDLSPAQAAAVGGRFSGPVRIRGAFGTGRSVAAAYRAVHLARTRSELVAIVVPAVAQIEPMRRRLESVAETDVLEQIVVDVPAGIARALLAEFSTEVYLAPESVARAWSVAQRSTGLGAAQGRSIGLLLDEVALIRGRSLTDERDYDRLRQEVPSGLRHQVWALHEAYLTELRQQNLPDEHDLVRMARAALRAGVPSELKAVVVDDANDLTLDQLMMLRETVGTGPDALTFIDDGLPGLLPVGATLGEAAIDVGQRQVDLAHEFRLTGPAWTSLVRLLQGDTGRDVVGTTDRPRLAGRLDDGEGPAYLRSQAIRLRRDRLVERVAELVSEGVPPASIALLHIEDEPEPELVAELVRAGVMVRGLDALDVPGVALGRARDARGVEFDHVLVPDARHRDVVPVGGLRWDQRQRRRLFGLALSRSRETAWIAGV